MEISVFLGVKVAFYGLLLAITILIVIGIITQYLNYIKSVDTLNLYTNSYICYLNLGIQEKLLNSSNFNPRYIVGLQSIGSIDGFSIKEYNQNHFVVIQCS